MRYNLSLMLALDIYLSLKSDSEYKFIKNTLSSKKEPVMPLMSWDIFSHGHSDRMQESKRSCDIAKVKLLAKKYNWKNNMDSIFKGEDFEAIIITNSEQKVVWVNRGFTKMTGYSKKDILDKTPKILQGPRTSPVVNRSINKNLKSNKPFMEIITNYRKNGEIYNCELKIYPLNDMKKNTHFIALERRVS